MSRAGDTLPPIRVSDAERERAIRALRDATTEGRLSSESFLGRVDDALRSRTRAELADLVRDLPSRARLSDLVVHGASSLSWFISRIRGAWHSPHRDRLSLPPDTERSYLLGRAPHCDLVLTHGSVSRSHARLQYGAKGWLLTDLGSTNGTRVNGWMLTRPEPVRPGDQVTLGSLHLLITR